VAYTPVKKQAITVQTLSMLKGQPYYLGFLSEIYKGEGIAGADGKPAKEPPHLARVVNLDTGEIVQAICPAVMVAELAKAFPEGVAGKPISCTIIPPKEGKKYSLCNLDLLEDKNFEQVYAQERAKHAVRVQAEAAPAQKARK